MAATKVVNRQLKTDLDTKVDKVLDSSLVADTEIAKLVAISGTNTGDQAIPATGVDFDPAGTDNSDNNAVNTLYSGLVTNATHTSEVTGSGALAVQPIAISNKTLKTTLVGTEEVLINDTTLKKTTTQDIADLVPPATAGAGTKDFIATGTIGAGAVVGLRSDGTVEVIEDTIVDGVFGTAVVFESGFTYDISSVYDSTDKKVMVFYSDKSNSYKGTYIVGDVSGTVITFGTAVIFNSGGADNISSVYDSTDKKVMVFYQDAGNSTKGTYIVGDVSGTVITFGTAVVFESGRTDYISSVYDSVDKKVMVFYRDVGNPYKGTYIVGDVSGTVITFGTAAVFESGSTYDISSVYDSTDKKVMVFYKDGGNSSKGTYIVGDVSGTVITFGTAVVFASTSTDNISSVYDSVDKKVMVFYRDVGNSYKGTYIVYSPEITTTNVLTKIGINTTAKTDAQTATITTIGGTNANQGGLTVGTFYYVQYDGVVTATPNESYDSKPLGFAISATEILLEN